MFDFMSLLVLGVSRFLLREYREMPGVATGSLSKWWHGALRRWLSSVASLGVEEKRPGRRRTVQGWRTALRPVAATHLLASERPPYAVAAPSALDETASPSRPAASRVGPAVASDDRRCGRAGLLGVEADGQDSRGTTAAHRNTRPCWSGRWLGLSQCLKTENGAGVELVRQPFVRSPSSWSPRTV